MRFHVAGVSPLLGFFLCATGCRTGASTGDIAGATSPAAQLDEEGIRGLAGYRSELVSAPVFGGQVFVMEAGEASAPAVVLVHGLGESACRDWYPVLPALYIALAAWICIVLLRYKPQYTWPGLVLVLLGIPVYIFWSRKTSAGLEAKE